MDNHKELEKKIEEKLFRIGVMVKKIVRVFLFNIGGISIFSFMIIVGTMLYGFRSFERHFFLAFERYSKPKSFGLLDLRGNSVLGIVTGTQDVKKGGTVPENLIDGDRSTVAAVGSSNLGYVIDLGSVHEVTEVTMYWGTYGRDANYIQHWTLEGREDISSQAPWIMLQEGGFPSSDQSVVSLKKMHLQQLRVKADGKNYIGIYEFSVVGKRVD